MVWQVGVWTRFWDRVTIGDGCWEWQRARGGDGYGSVSYDGDGGRMGTGPTPAAAIAWIRVAGGRDVSEPRTEAGKALLERGEMVHPELVHPGIGVRMVAVSTVREAVLAIETEAAKLERERLRDAVGAAIERNHGQRGHPQPFIDCQREICKWGWDAPIDIFAEPAP